MDILDKEYFMGKKPQTNTLQQDKFRVMFELQKELQNKMFLANLPDDSVEDFKYSVLGMISELGEVLDADRRWKNVRAKPENKAAKLEEIADVLAFFINMCLYSGYDSHDIYEAFINKTYKNFERI